MRQLELDEQEEVLDLADCDGIEGLVDIDTDQPIALIRGTLLEVVVKDYIRTMNDFDSIIDTFNEVLASTPADILDETVDL